MREQSSRDKPLAGIRVLLTRSFDSDDETRALFEARGAEVRALPLIRVGPPPNPHALRDAAARFEQGSSFVVGVERTR